MGLRSPLVGVGVHPGFHQAGRSAKCGTGSDVKRFESKDGYWRPRLLCVQVGFSDIKTGKPYLSTRRRSACKFPLNFGEGSEGVP